MNEANRITMVYLLLLASKDACACQNSSADPNLRSILFDAKRKFNGFDYHWVSIFAAVSSFLAELITNAVWLLYLILRVRFPIQL